MLIVIVAYGTVNGVYEKETGKEVQYEVLNYDIGRNCEGCGEYVSDDDVYLNDGVALCPACAMAADCLSNMEAMGK